MDQVLAQLQAALTPLLLAASTAFIGWAFTELRTVFHLNVTDNAETSIRTAAATEAGKLAATVPAAAVAAVAVTSSPTASLSSLFPTGAIQAAASKVISDLPAEVKATGYTPTDIFDMILGNLPSILGTFNPALGAAASVIESVAKRS